MVLKSSTTPIEKMLVGSNPRTTLATSTFKTWRILAGVDRLFERTVLRGERGPDQLPDAISHFSMSRL